MVGMGIYQIKVCDECKIDSVEGFDICTVCDFCE